MSSFKNLFAADTVTATKPLNHMPVIHMSNVAQGIEPIKTNAHALANPFYTRATNLKTDMEISEFGTEAGKEISALADKVLQKTTTGKMGDFGTGITDILKLTSSVNVSDLNIDKSKGLWGKIVSGFKDKKVEVIANFQNTGKSIEKIVDDLSSRQVQMVQDNLFLEQLYDKNMEEYHALGSAVDAGNIFIAELQIEYNAKQAAAQNSTDQFELQALREMEARIKLWEKQVDRLKRMQHVALLTAPEIRQIQAGNVAMVQKFQDLAKTTIPAWKKQLSLTILAIQQKENAELGNTIDDKTNEFFRKAADLNHSNAIAVAQNSQRSVVDIETLEHMQTQLLDSVKQVKVIEETGRQERAAASTKIDQLRDQMKTEMLSWGK